MTAAARINAVPAAPPGELLAGEGLFAGRVLLDERSAVLASRIGAAFLAEAGWDPGTWVLTLPAEHPLLGRTFCRAPGCQTTCAAATRVCLDCQRRLTAAGLDLEDVALLPPPQGKRWLGAGDGTCRVTGCPRPWVTSGQPPCPEHLGQQEQLGVSTADFTVRADAVALPSHGICLVASCPRQLPGHDAAYCDAHLQRLRVLRRSGHHPDEAAWRVTEPPVPRAGQVSLAGLAPAVAVEMLFGLQQRTRQGVKTYCTILRPVANDARSQQVRSLAGLDIPAVRGQGYASVVHTLITHARRGISDPGTEIARDTWDMGCSGTAATCRSPRSPSRGCARPPRSGRWPTCPAAAGAAAGTRPATTCPAWPSCRPACGSALTAARTRPRWAARISSCSSTASATCMPPGRSASSPGWWAAARSASC